MCDGADIFLCVLSILFPPIGVWVKRGICSADSLINICLCMLGYLPGLIHAWYIISSYPDPGYERVDGSEAQVHVYYVRGGPPPPSAGPGPGGHSTPQAGYGTIGGSGAPAPTRSSATQAQQPKSQAQPKMQSEPSGSQQVPSASSAAAVDAPAPVNKQQGEDPGPSEAPPPPYAEVVQGDNKIQSHE